jgi:hypothetical protein
LSRLPLLSWRKVVKPSQALVFRLHDKKESSQKNGHIVPVPKHKEIKRDLLMEITCQRQV